MDLSPIFVIPDKYRTVATPNDFIYNDFGMTNATIPKEAVRLSRVINKLYEAFRDNDSILSGFVISDFTYDKTKSYSTFTLSNGEAIIDNTFISLPYPIDVKWSNVTESIPANVNYGKILIYIAFEYSSFNNISRPIPQDHPWSSMPSWPVEQVTFNPAMIKAAYYDPTTKKFIADGWDQTSHIVLISSQFYFERESSTVINVWFNDQTKGLNTDIIFDGTTVTYDDQSGGLSASINLIDGGDIDEATEEIIAPSGIVSLYNSDLKYSLTNLTLTNITYPNEIYVFYNGALYSSACNDYNLGETSITFLNPKILTAKSTLQIIENIPSNILGYFKKIINTTISNSNTNYSTNAVTVNDISPANKYLVFYNGVNYQHGIDYVLTDNTITFRSAIDLTIDKSFVVVQIIEGTGDAANVKVCYDDVVINTGRRQVVFGLSANSAYLVFYNGLLYRASTDYIVTDNMIEFKKIQLVVGNSLKIIKV